MSFNNRQQFIDSAASEKIVLAHVHANARVINFVSSVDDIYEKSVPHFPIAVKAEDTPLTMVYNILDMVAGSAYYNIKTGILYIWLLDSSDPLDSEIIVTYRLFFSNNPVSLPWNLLDDTDDDVYYDGRITASPGFKQKIGIEQSLNSMVGSGDLSLENNDSSLDEIFDRYIFDNQDIKIYSWNRDLSVSEAQLIFKGKVTNKTYESSSIRFTIKDVIYELQQNIPQDIYSESDNVNSNVVGDLKRWVYGRVDGLKLQSIDQIGEGYALTGTVSITAANKILTGVGTSFLSQVSPDDKLFIATLEFTVESVDSNTQITLSGTPNYAVNGATAIIVPDIPVRTKNRIQFVAGHACAKITRTVVNALQFNRIVISDTTGLEAGDFITFQSSGERKEIKNIAPGNIVVLRDNVITLPTLASEVTREPIQKVYISGETVNPADYTITTIVGETYITLDQDAEYNIASPKEFNISMTFTNGSRIVTYAGDVSLSEIFSPRDFIRPNDPAYTTYYEILAVEDTQITLRTVFSDLTTTETVEAKLPDYVGDETVISADVLGKTEDGEPEGEWIRTGAKAVQDLLNSANISGIDTTTFDDVSLLAPQLISIAFPLQPGKTLVSIKSAIDLLNRSIRCSIGIDSELRLKYESIIAQTPEIIKFINDSDVIKWSIRSTNGKNYRNSIIRYRHTDVNNATLESGNKVSTFSSEFVERYVGTNQTYEDDLYIYHDIDAEIAAEREVYYNSLGLSTITVDSDLRLEAYEMGDQVVLDFKRLYKRFGDASTRKKLVTCVGKTVNGNSIQLEFSDYGNTFNTSAFITKDDADDFSSADVDQKIVNGYITDPEGIVDDNEDTNKTNLIS